MKMNWNHTLNKACTWLSFILCSLVFIHCEDDKEVIVPDNWVTIPGESLSIGYEGGELTADYELAGELDANAVYVINEETWCSGYIKDGKLVFDIAASTIPEERTAISYLIYDDLHQVELVIKQGAAPVVPVENIVVSDELPESIYMHQTIDLASYFSALPENASYKTFTYSVDDESIATVTTDGKLTGVWGGVVNVNVTAIDEGRFSITVPMTVESNVLYSTDGWTVETSVDYGYCPDGTTGKPEDILDGDLSTFLSLVKPGKTYNSCTTPADHVLHFVVDCQEETEFNYFYFGWRSSNSSTYLRIPEVQLYGSHDGTTFERIGDKITTDRTKNLNYELPLSTYRYVKVEYTSIDTSSGSTVQVAEFRLGRDYERD